MPRPWLANIEHPRISRLELLLNKYMFAFMILQETHLPRWASSALSTRRAAATQAEWPSASHVTAACRQVSVDNFGGSSGGSHNVLSRAASGSFRQSSGSGSGKGSGSRSGSGRGRNASGCARGGLASGRAVGAGSEQQRNAQGTDAARLQPPSETPQAVQVRSARQVVAVAAAGPELRMKLSRVIFDHAGLVISLGPEVLQVSSSLSSPHGRQHKRCFQGCANAPRI